MLSVPWQVTHGLWIGWTAAAAVVVLGGVLTWLWVLWLARRRAKRIIHSFGEGTGVPVPGAVVLRGRLEVPGAPVPSLDGTGAAAACSVEASSERLRFVPLPTITVAHFRAPSLHIRFAQGSAALRGAVSVAAGSREFLPGSLSLLDGEDRDRLLASPDDALTFRHGSWPKDLRVGGVIRTLRHGDEVIVRGVLQKSIADAGPGASYRPMATTLELVAAQDTEAIEVSAIRVMDVSFGKATLLIRGLAAGIALAIGVGIAVGAAARNVDDERVAALVPPYRGWAVDMLAQQAVIGPPSQNRLATVLAYHDLVPDCRRTGRALMDHGQWAHAATMLASCEEEDSLRLAMAAYRVEGQFAKACEIAERVTPAATRSQAAYLLLGGCYGQAAAVLRRVATETSARDDGDVTLQCLADALDQLAGKRSDSATFVAGVSEGCQIVQADALDGPARMQILSSLADAPLVELKRYRYRTLLALLMAERDVYSVEFPALSVPPIIELMTQPTHATAGRAHRLEYDVLMNLAALKEPRFDQRRLRRNLALRVASFEILAGHAQEAFPLIELADKDNVVARREATTNMQSDAWVESIEAEAEAVGLRVLAHVMCGQVDAASRVMEPWSDTSPARFVRDIPSFVDGPSALSRIQSVVVRHVDDAAVVVAVAKDKTLAGKTIADELASALFGEMPTNTSAAVGSLQHLPWMVGTNRIAPQPSDRMSWVQASSRTPVDSPMLAMWQAAVAHRIATLSGVVDGMDQSKRALEAYRSAMMNRSTTIILALLWDEGA